MNAFILPCKAKRRGGGGREALGGGHTEANLYYSACFVAFFYCIFRVALGGQNVRLEMNMRCGLWLRVNKVK